MIAKLKSNNYKISLVIMTILMLLFYRSFYWESSELCIRKILEALIIITGIVVIPVVIVAVPVLNSVIDGLRKRCISLVKYIKDNALRVVILVCAYFFILGFSAFVELCIDGFIYHTAFNVLRFYIIVAFNTIIYICYIARGIIDTKPELIFFMTVMIIGLTYIKVTPPIVGLSWDDQIHYERTLFLANYLNGTSYAADAKMIGECENNSIQRTGYDRQSREDYVNELTQMYDNREMCETVVPQFTIGLVSYIPSAIGIILARGAGLSYSHIFAAGKICNLLLYAILMYFAIKKLRFGKVFTAVFGMLPLIVFLASSYSYDSWLIAFSALGFSYVISSMYEADKNKCIADMIWGVIFVGIGCLVKQVYFPLIFIAIFIAMINCKERKKDLIKITLIVAAVTIVLILSFVIPMLFSPESASDLRGGTDVNAISQIKYVISNPLIYARTLFTFLKSYLAIENMSYLTSYAYVGNGEYWGITVVTLVVIAFLDRSSEMRNHKFIRIIGILLSFLTIVIVASALYAAFTSVGADTIAGCSPRYIVPVLFPVFYLLAPDGVNVSYSRKMLLIVPLIIMSVVVFNSMNVLCASLYI